MAIHIPNRRGLDDSEITELDDIATEYDAARERARTALIAAQTAYQATIRNAADRRDDRILGIIDSAGGRGTQSRVVEHLGMNPSYLSLRLRKARARATVTTVVEDATTDPITDESVTPHQKGDALSSTHKPPTQRR